MIRRVYATAKTYKKKSRKVKNSTIKAPVRGKKKAKAKKVVNKEENSNSSKCYEDCSSKYEKRAHRLTEGDSMFDTESKPENFCQDLSKKVTMTECLEMYSMLK
jgi:hypothetical protein